MSKRSTPVEGDSISGSGLFTFWNGDTYAGEFSVLKDREKIVMQGKGVYKTGDNETYEGIWEGDYLKKCKIVFNDKSSFNGSLDNMKPKGLGTYKFKENVEIEGEFFGDSLVGKVNLKDPSKHTWQAEAEQSDILYFYPLHPYWQDIINLPLKNTIFLGEAEEDYASHNFF